MSRWTEKIQNVFAAITFAEADCPDVAREFLKGDPGLQPVMVPAGQSIGLDDFIAAVGLSGTKVWYGVVEAG